MPQVAPKCITHGLRWTLLALSWKSSANNNICSLCIQEARPISMDWSISSWQRSRFSWSFTSSSSKSNWQPTTRWKSLSSSSISIYNPMRETNFFSNSKQWCQPMEVCKVNRSPNCGWTCKRANNSNSSSNRWLPKKTTYKKCSITWQIRCSSQVSFQLRLTSRTRTRSMSMSSVKKLK